MKKIYKIYGDNISGGQHSSYFVVIADSLSAAKNFIKNKIDELKTNECYDIDNNWSLDEENTKEIELEDGIIYMDTGDCC